MRVSVVATTLWIVMRIASAEPTPQERSKALFDEGRARIEAHDDLGACAKFNEAIKLDPDAAGTMLNLGLCNQNLKKIRLALYWFRKAQARAHESNLPEYEAAAGARTKDLVDQVATIKLEVSPDDAHVKLDGEEISPADYLHVEVDVGHHVLDARSPGHESTRQQFDVVGKGGDTITVKLAVGDDMIDIYHPTRKRIGFITGAGGVVLMGASLVVNLVARSHYNKCVSNGVLKTSTECAGYDYTKDQDHAKYWGTALFTVGAVATVTGAILLFTSHSRERINQTALIPTVSSDGAGVAAVGSF